MSKIDRDRRAKRRAIVSQKVDAVKRAAMPRIKYPGILPRVPARVVKIARKVGRTRQAPSLALRPRPLVAVVPGPAKPVRWEKRAAFAPLTRFAERADPLVCKQRPADSRKGGGGPKRGFIPWCRKS